MRLPPRIILILPAILLVIQVLDLSTCVVPRFFAIETARVSALEESVRLDGCQSGEGFFGFSVGDGFAVAALVGFPVVHGFEGGSAGEDLV